MTADLLDLLRLACATGKMRLNVGFGAERGYQANLANSGNGWTIDYDRDSLEAITKVLRIRFGRQLERRRAESPAAFRDGSIGPEDVVEAVQDVFRGQPVMDSEVRHLAERVAEQLFPAARPVVHDDAPLPDDDIAGLIG